MIWFFWHWFRYLIPDQHLFQVYFTIILLYFSSSFMFISKYAYFCVSCVYLIVCVLNIKNVHTRVNQTCREKCEIPTRINHNSIFYSYAVMQTITMWHLTCFNLIHILVNVKYLDTTKEEIHSYYWGYDAKWFIFKYLRLQLYMSGKNHWFLNRTDHILNIKHFFFKVENSSCSGKCLTILPKHRQSFVLLLVSHNEFWHHNF